MESKSAQFQTSFVICFVVTGLGYSGNIAFISFGSTASFAQVKVPFSFISRAARVRGPECCSCECASNADPLHSD